ncbi:MAG: MOSC domain-containing protein [Chloroflexota bacterium]
MPTVSQLAIAPVKGLALLHPPVVHLGRDGVAENRRFFLMAGDGRHRSGLAFGTLACVEPVYDPATETLALRLPDAVVSGSAIAEGPRVEVPWGSRLLHGRLVDGPFSAALSEFIGEDLRLVRADDAEHLQSYPASIISTASLEALSASAGLAALDDRRFRMLVTIDGVDAFGEDAWIGSEVSIGAAVVHVELPTSRCATTTRDPATGLRDWDALRAVKNLRGLSPTNTIDFGVYATVVTPGTIGVGDEVRPATEAAAA